MIDFTSWIKGSLEINLPEDRIWETSICWSRICLILHRGRGRVCIHWWGWWCKLSWPSTSRWSCRWSGRGQGTGGRNSAGHKNSQTRQRNLFIIKAIFNAEVSYQNNDPQESNAYEKLVKVSEDIPLERWDRTQEAAVEVEFILRLLFFLSMENLSMRKRTVVEVKAKMARRKEASTPISI